MEFFKKTADDKKTFIYNMTKYKDYKQSINVKKECVDTLRDYNNNYKCDIVKSYRNYIEYDDDDIWNAQPPHYNEMVVGYLIHNNNIIPYTEASSIETIHNVLLNDVRFKFMGDDDDLNFQYTICFLISVGFLQPRDEYDNLIFDVVSLFNGANTRTDIKKFVELTHFIQHRNKTHYDFNFNIENIVRKDDFRLYNKNRIKLTLKLVNDVLANKQTKDTAKQLCLTH